MEVKVNDIGAHPNGEVVLLRGDLIRQVSLVACIERCGLIRQVSL